MRAAPTDAAPDSFDVMPALLGEGKTGREHLVEQAGILSLRNPSDQPADIALNIGEVFELPASAARTYSLNSPWQKDAAATPIASEMREPYSRRLR